jgi:hypothetical protein
MKPTSESLSAQEARHLSVAEGNCVSARAGGEQSEAKDQPRTQVNSIRPCPLASCRTGGVCGAHAPGAPSEARGTSHAPSCGITSSKQTWGGGGVFGAGMVGRLDGVSQDCCPARGWPGRQQSPHSSVETGNDRGAKGGRKTNALIETRPTTPGAVSDRTTPPGDSGSPQPEWLRMSQGSCLVWTERMLQALERGNEGRKWPLWQRLLR